MSHFIVWIVRVEGDNHWQALSDVAEGVHYSLTRLGHAAQIVNKNPGAPNDSRLIVFNAHRLPPDWKLPENAIIYNAEQVQSTWGEHPYVKLLRKHTVWDYSAINIERLRLLGVERVIHCRVGYWPGLVSAPPLVTETFDTDVLFIGSINARRTKILREIAVDRRLTVKSRFDVYGAERDSWIARAKIVINVHFYPQPIFEIFRVSKLLANTKCVVTEDGGCDPELEALAKISTVYVPYEKLAEACATLVSDTKARQETAAKGFDIFSKFDQVEFVRSALEQS
jgi:hypothetical protein